jgi:hypothetical protein
LRHSQPTHGPAKSYPSDFKGKTATKKFCGFTNYRGQSVNFSHFVVFDLATADLEKYRRRSR